ncbi:helix-turn-helix transcriptional regulator [Acidobacteria bacterium AB60]|nr:helix-turn-helix transcriptional regulator [Acidobacteria bacterium AB60]
MYDLFLLGKLMERPWYGYEFHQALNAFVGPMRQVSWGTIYPTLRRLEQEGTIRRTSTPADLADKRGRQRYSITPAGRLKFHDLMDPEHLKGADYRDIFRIMLGNFSRVKPEKRRHLIEGYLERLAAVIRHAEEMAKRVKSGPQFQNAERKDILIALDRDRVLAEADRKWILDRLQNG